VRSLDNEASVTSASLLMHHSQVSDSLAGAWYSTKRACARAGPPPAHRSLTVMPAKRAAARCSSFSQGNGLRRVRGRGHGTILDDLTVQVMATRLT
jgi:hypothetical protein